MEQHINPISNQANQYLGFLKRNLKIKFSDVKSHAYKALGRTKWSMPRLFGIPILEPKLIRLKRFRDEHLDT